MQRLVISEGSKALVHVLVCVKVGWRHEVAGKRGISHALEHALFLGNRSHPSPDCEVGEYGVQLSGMTNPERTLFYFTSTKEDFPAILRILLSLIFHPELKEDKLAKEKREKIMPAVVKESDFTPWELAHEWARNLVFNWDFMQSLGVGEDIASLTKEDLEAWHRRYYHALNSCIVIYGNVQESVVTRLIRDAEIPSGAEVPVPFGVQWNRKEVFVKKTGIDNVEIVYGFRVPQYDAGLEILRVILGNYPISKLCGDLFSGFTYTAGSTMEWTSTGGGLFLYFGASSSSNVREIDNNLWVLSENFEITQREFMTAKKIRSLEILNMKEEGEHGLLTFALHNPFAEYRDFSQMLEKVKRVRKEEVSSLAKRLLDRENVVKVTVSADR